jgi:thymidylate synthase ThyX
MIHAKIIADSQNEFGNRLTTFIITFPRFILAELNTHRMFSRNSASSRAIPFKKMVESVQKNPFIPIAWQKDHSGMQGTEYIEGVDRLALQERWLDARNAAVKYESHISGIARNENLNNGREDFPRKARGWSGNFRGFIQYRKTLANENRTVATV